MQTGSLIFNQIMSQKARIRRAEKVGVTQAEIIDAGLRFLESKIRARESKNIYCKNGGVND